MKYRQFLLTRKTVEPIDNIPGIVNMLTGKTIDPIDNIPEIVNMLTRKTVDPIDNIPGIVNMSADLLSRIHSVYIIY